MLGRDPERKVTKYMDVAILLVTALLVVTSMVYLWPLRLKRTKLSSKDDNYDVKTRKQLDNIKSMAEVHQVASTLGSLIREDGAGSWPPLAEHDHTVWPQALRPYKEIYLDLAPLLPQADPSLDDEANEARIAEFRTRFRNLLGERIDMNQVKQLLEAADSGRWDVFPRAVYNAFYCCIATSRHAYRWATIPVVRVAQLEKVVSLPAELEEPWVYLQRHFGCPSDSGNNMSNLVLNFDVTGKHIYKINTDMSARISTSEEEFARIFYEVERLALSVYHDIVLAIVSFARDDKAACARHMAGISSQLRPILNSYYERLHDKTIALSAWLSHVQGFYAWGAGTTDATSGEWDKFDGLSGNQILVFQVLDAFLGIEQYLSPKDQERNVPHLQRAFCKAVEKHSFRGKVGQSLEDENEARIVREFDEIIKRLRVFRSAHRTRAKLYLSHPAPERLPMTAGKSVLKTTMNDSLAFLDHFMVGRLNQTV